MTKMLTMIAPPTVEAVAYHEAGHAIAGAAWVGDVHEVSIVRVEGQREGICVTRSGGTLDRPAALANAAERSGDARALRFVREMLLGHARYVLAGFCAEFIFSGRRMRVATIDVDEVKSAHARIALAHKLEDRDGIVHWLYASLEERRTRRFLREHWRHVHAVARALLKSKTIDEGMFRALLARLPPIRAPRYRS